MADTDPETTSIDLTADEALVLFEFLQRFSESDVLTILNRPGFRGGSNSGEWSHEEVPEVFARGA